jgi:hypothetical protein
MGIESRVLDGVFGGYSTSFCRLGKKIGVGEICRDFKKTKNLRRPVSLPSLQNETE